jgi:hypothetical protein
MVRGSNSVRIRGFSPFSSSKENKTEGGKKKELSRLFVELKLPPIQWVLGFFLRVMWLGREADDSRPCSAEIRMSGAIPSVPYMPS